MSMDRQRGFTITELSIAMTMLSVLLVVIVLSATHMTGIYNKGITLKRVNQSGRSISTELQNDLRRAGGGNDNKVLNISYRESEVNGEQYTTGACIGDTSYIWSLYLDNGDIIEEKFSSGERVSFIKIKSSEMCETDGSGSYPEINKESSSILLEDDLVVREPTTVVVGSTSIIRFQYTISTPDTGVITDGVCSGGKDQEFCALNTFEVTAYADI